MGEDGGVIIVVFAIEIAIGSRKSEHLGIDAIARSRGDQKAAQQRGNLCPYRNNVGCARIEIVPLRIHQTGYFGSLARRDVSLGTVAERRPSGGCELFANAVAWLADGWGILNVEPAIVGAVPLWTEIDICSQRTGIPTEQVAGIGHYGHSGIWGESLRFALNLVVRDSWPGTPAFAFHRIQISLLGGCH